MTLNKKYINLSEFDLQKIAQQLCMEINNHNITVCLYGDLGAGKTTFCRAFIQQFMEDIHHTVPSPTFNIVQEYQNKNRILAHFDCYRIKDEMELLELNFDEYIHNSICLIEWPQNIKNSIPQHYIQISIHKETDSTRSLKITEKI